MKDLLLDLDGTRAILADPKTTSVRLVLNLEKMVIKEAQRAYTYLNLYDYVTDAVGGEPGAAERWQGQLPAVMAAFPERHHREQVESAFGGPAHLVRPVLRAGGWWA